MQTRDPEGYTKEMKDINESFLTHHRLLVVLKRLNIINNLALKILQSDFEQNTWTKLRDGDDIEWL